MKNDLRRIASPFGDWRFAIGAILRRFAPQLSKIEAKTSFSVMTLAIEVVCGEHGW